MITLSCGHPHEPGLANKVGDSITCYICKCTVQVMASSNSPRPPRAVIDSMLSCVLRMMQDAQDLNNTGDTWENILARAKVRLYDDLDATAGPPRGLTPAPPLPPIEADELKRLRIKDRMLRWMVTQPGTDMHTLIKAIEGAYVTTSPTEPENLWIEYLALFQDLDAIRAALGMAPYPKGSLNAGEVYAEVVALVGRCKALQQIATHKTPPGSFGTDMNSFLHLIKNLVRKT